MAFDSGNFLLPLGLFNFLVLLGIAIALVRNFPNSQLNNSKKLSETSADLAENPENAKLKAELKQECLQLRQQLSDQRQELAQEFRQSSFKQLQALLTQYPSLVKMVEAKPDLPAKNLVALLGSLEQLTQTWNYEPIGKAWEQVEFDPQLHQADSSEIQPKQLVYIRFIGYRDRDLILVPAKVSLTLPGGLTK
jgi:molecular chaperone GrpE (heat shock protein)